MMFPGERITPLTALPETAIALVVVFISCFINSRCKDSVEYRPGYFAARNVNFIVLVGIFGGDYLAPWVFFVAFLASTSRRVVRKNDTIV
ncbi:TPA: hypothetical protein I3820_002029 [Enterobacter cloacae]|nr:hypothetical protein [Enterobacter cloacae]